MTWSARARSGAPPRSSRASRLRGLLGYEGHCASEPDRATREREVRRRDGAASLEVASAFRAEGLPVDVVSAGATGTYDLTGAIDRHHRGAGRVVHLDGSVPRAARVGFRVRALRRRTAISVHGDLVVFDAGRKAVGGDLGPPAAPGPGGEFAFIHEEHVGFRYPGGAPFRVGDRAALVPGYAPTAVNLLRRLPRRRGGQVVDRWPVRARHGEP